ncbi:MAG: bifunctional precorrin-2 dehydrogenase/sirohydrochlorin ferrochelatase [Thermodesulfobacteriota bacterium]
MKYYPVFLDVSNRQCLVVGGGSVGTRKVKSLVECGARVTVVALSATAELERMAAAGIIRLEKRAYAAADMNGVFLTFGATSDMTVNDRVRRDAESHNILCNIADYPAGCNFILPSVVQRGDLQIAVSTSGKSPAFARALRKELEGRYGKEYDVFLRLMGMIREKLLAAAHEPEAHKPLFERLIASSLPELIRQRRRDEIDRVLVETLGPGFSSRDLGFDW